MCTIIEEAISSKLQGLLVGLNLRTPDNAVGVPFSVIANNVDNVEVQLNSGNSMNICHSALFTTMLFLIRNGHDLLHPVNIESNDNPVLSGPLCTASRLQNNNIRCINYVLPILSHFGYVGISGTRPNSCWYI
jgi:hypothetical protein